MDVLVALGTTASYGYAIWGLWKNDHESTHFFETSATLICFILAGKWMRLSVCCLALFQIPTTILFEKSHYEQWDSLSALGGVCA